MGFFEREGLPRSSKQIDRAGVNEQNNIIVGDIDRRYTKKPFLSGRHGFVYRWRKL